LESVGLGRRDMGRVGEKGVWVEVVFVRGLQLTKRKAGYVR
jgi:hypothetical protein